MWSLGEDRSPRSSTELDIESHGLPPQECRSIVECAHSLPSQETSFLVLLGGAISKARGNSERKVTCTPGQAENCAWLALFQSQAPCSHRGNMICAQPTNHLTSASPRRRNRQQTRRPCSRRSLRSQVPSSLRRLIASSTTPPMHPARPSPLTTNQHQTESPCES